MSTGLAAARPVVWSAPVVLMRGRDALFRVPAVAADGSHAFVLAGPPTEAVPGEPGAAARDRSSLWSVRTGDAAAIPPPPGDFSFVFPRAGVGADGALHVVWGKPAIHPGANAADLRLLRVTSLWHAAYYRGAWSVPLRIWQGGRVNWEPERSSGLVADAAGGLHLAFSGEEPGGRWTLTHLRYRRGSWLRSEPGSVAPAAYTDLAVGPGGEVAVVYAAARTTAGGGFVNALYLTRSRDPGAGWSEPRVIGGPQHWPAYEPRVSIDPERGIHVIWQRHLPGSSRTEAFWHAATADGGVSWNGFASRTADGVFSGTQAAMDPAGGIHLVFTAFHTPRPQIGYTTFGPQGWTAPASLFPGRMNLQPSLRVAAGSLHLAWVAQPAGAELPSRPATADTISWFEVVYSTAKIGAR